MKKYITPEIKQLGISAQTILTSSGGRDSGNGSGGFGNGSVNQMQTKQTINFQF